MYLDINFLLFFLTLFLFLTLLYRRIMYGEEIFRSAERKYSILHRNVQKDSYLKQFHIKPTDLQKVLLKETFTLLFFFFIIFVIGTKAIFLVAVVSGSMSPVFNKDDLVLMQNIEHTYRPGDIIMFTDPYTSRPYTHRITRIIDGRIFTAGDAIGIEDAWEIQTKDILGKAVIIQGKPVVIKGYGKFFIIDAEHKDFGSIFGSDYNNYVLFINVVRMYGYVIALGSVLIYIILTFRKKS